ncbi:MDR efflux pump AcrAB transcriptional activator RobA [Proteus myxofaciens]|uniref:SoxS family regulatory protein n=1 Tax=Proteus myxofaciens ATCC 19692 TaxID=1354337 RepID=A0A198FMJ9_9GAMM|nr:MDR efflux pump AcrAB transcriptional activator RobA [Proteus myxofaciens]OAT26177.1 SoxS family regulatory protein [Proteus myxofaciens ATCC 19692]
MDQTNIIRDLLAWLDNNLDKPLSLDNVATKAGYSKWHLQRMFKEVTGEAIGSYIRSRRLSRAAVALRLTSRPILDIALQYRFDSQQTFTRAFKKQFDRTPALYRRTDEWCAVGIHPPISLEPRKFPKWEFVQLEDTKLIGIEQTCSHTLEQWANACSDMRQIFWRYYMSKINAVPHQVYGLHHTQHSHDHEDEQHVLYTTAVEPEYASFIKDDTAHEVTLAAGDYIRFDFEGEARRGAMQEFLFLLYGVCLPTMGLTRRKGYDIEKYYLKNVLHSNEMVTEPQDHIDRFEYYIPIKREENVTI